MKIEMRLVATDTPTKPSYLNREADLARVVEVAQLKMDKS